MVGVAGGVVLIDMASRAVLRGAGEAVVHVAGLARRGGVFSSKGEPGDRIVITPGTVPLSGVVARGAAQGETGGFVIRIGALVEVVEVAGGAILGRSGEAIIDVAGLALCGGVLAGKRVPGGGVVVEPGTFPLCGGVAGGAVERESGGLVIWGDNVVEVIQVAAGAILGRPGEAVADVALLAGDR